MKLIYAELKQELEEKVLDTDNLDNQIESRRSTLAELHIELEKMASSLREQRIRVIHDLVSQLEDMLKPLGMPNARFKITLQEMPDFNTHPHSS